MVAQARLVILNVYSFFCGGRDDLERLYILNDYSSVQYNVRRDELASFPSNSLSKARAVFKKMLTVGPNLKKLDYSRSAYRFGEGAASFGREDLVTPIFNFIHGFKPWI